MLQKRNTRGILLTLIGGILWGLSGTCGQFLFEQKGLTTAWLVPVRLLSAGFILLVFTILQGKMDIFAIWKNKKDAFEIVIFAIFGMAMCQFPFFQAIAFSNAGTATVLQYLGPVFIMAYISVRRKQMPQKNELIAIVCALIGTFLLATHGNIHTLAISTQALTWGLISAVALAVYTIYPARLLGKWGAFATTGWGMFIAGILLCLVFRPWHIVGNWDMGTFTAMLVIVILGTVVSFTCYLEGVRCIGPTKGSLYASIEPISATIFSTLWLKVNFQWIDLLGFVFIISTVFLLAVKSKSKSKIEQTGSKD